MNKCLETCQRFPSMKKKVQNTLYNLEQSMIEYKALKG